MSLKLAKCPTNALQLLACTVFHPNFSYKYLLVKELKAAKTRLVLALKTFRRREDLKTRIKIKTRRELSASIAVQQAKTRQEQADIEVTVAEGRQGLRSNYRESWMKSNTPKKRDGQRGNMSSRESETKRNGKTMCVDKIVNYRKVKCGKV